MFFSSGACKENHHTHILSVCSLQMFQWECLLFAYLCLPVRYLSSSHGVWVWFSHSHLSKFLFFCFCQTNNLRTMLETVAGSRRTQRFPWRRGKLRSLQKHNVACGLFDDDAPAGHFHFLFLYNRWIIVFLLISGWVRDIPLSRPTAAHIRHAPRRQMSVSLCKICREKCPSLVTDVLLCDLWSTITL